MPSDSPASIFFVQVTGTPKTKEFRKQQYAQIQGHLAKAGHVKRARQLKYRSSSSASPSDSKNSSDDQAECSKTQSLRLVPRSTGISSTHIQIPRSSNPDQPESESEAEEVEWECIPEAGTGHYSYRQEMRKAYWRDRMSAFIGLTYAIKRSSSDPFFCVEKSDPLDVYKSNDFFWGVTVPSHTALAHYFGFENQWGGCLSSAVREPIYWYATSSLLAVVREGMTGYDVKVPPQILQYLGYTLEAFRERLKDPRAYADNLSVLLSVYLIELSFRLHDFQACEVHRNNLQKMVKHRGGLDNLGVGGRIKGVIMDYDFYWTIETGHSTFPDARPIYPSTILDRSDSTVERLIGRLPPGFQRLADSGCISLDLVQVLARLADTVTIQADPRATTFFDSELDSPMLPSELKKNIFESCPTLSRIKTPDTILDVESAVAMSIMLYMCRNMMSHRTVFGKYQGIRKRLTRGLAPFSEIASQAERECWIWVYMITIEAWRNLKGELEMEGDRLLQQFYQHHNTGPNGGAWAYLDRVVNCFFWSSHLSRSFKCSWDITAERAQIKHGKPQATTRVRDESADPYCQSSGLTTFDTSIKDDENWQIDPPDGAAPSEMLPQDDFYMIYASDMGW